MFAEFDLILCMFHRARARQCWEKIILFVPEQDGKLHELSRWFSNLETAEEPKAESALG